MTEDETAYAFVLVFVQHEDEDEHNRMPLTEIVSYFCKLEDFRPR